MILCEPILPEPVQRVPALSCRGTAAPAPIQRVIAEETAIAITYNRHAYAVMMATPADLEDFARGFSLHEGVVDHAGAIEELEVIQGADGIELRMWIAADAMEAVQRRRRFLAGPTGCGLCGMESLEQAMRPPPRIAADARFSVQQIAQAAAALAPAQTWNHAARALHAAGFWRPEGGMLAVREDVGRHNALDKLAGALAASGISPAAGLVVMSSRISVELVQKAARMGAGMLVAVSAPTALALRQAEACNLSLVGIARDDGFEVFTGRWRLLPGGAEMARHVA